MAGMEPTNDAMPDEALATLAWTYKPSTNGRLPIFHNFNTIGQS
jgi:hypothetical protein